MRGTGAGLSLPARTETASSWFDPLAPETRRDAAWALLLVPGDAPPSWVMPKPPPSAVQRHGHESCRGRFEQGL